MLICGEEACNLKCDVCRDRPNISCFRPVPKVVSEIMEEMTA